MKCITVFTSLSLTFTLLLISTTFGQMTSVDSSRAFWLEKHMYVLEGWGRGDLQNEADVEVIADILKNYRVVSMGEPTHGDGTAFKLRQNITEQVTEKSDSWLLGLESLGLFQSVEALENNDAAWMWTGSEQARPGIMHFIERSHNSAFRLKGFDVQHKSTKNLFDQTKNALEKSAGEYDNQLWQITQAVLMDKFAHPFSRVSQDTMEMALEGSRQFIRMLSESGMKRESQFLKNARANALVPFKRTMTPRGRQMADNVSYLLEEYPNRSIVLWGATSHLAKTLSAIDNMKSGWSYDMSLPMGKLIDTRYEDTYFSLVFTACSGSYGAEHIGLDSTSIPKPKTGSIEQLACSAEFDGAAFINLRELAKKERGEWLLSPLLARPLGYEFMRASWPLVLDALIVVRNMTPVEPIKNKK